jgi:hypothetical protein
MTHIEERARKVHNIRFKWNSIRPNYPNQVFLKDLRLMRENTELLFYRVELVGAFELEIKKRQFIKIQLSGKFITDTGRDVWTITTRDLDGLEHEDALRANGAVRSRRHKGWRQDKWIALNTEIV